MMRANRLTSTLICCVLLLLSNVAGAERKKNVALERALQEWRAESTEEIRYIPAFADLNEDGKPEAIVYILGKDECGSGGCPTVIFTPSGTGYKLVAEIPLTHPPIRVSRRKSHGWHNLIVFVAGGGIVQGYNAELAFDGKSYPDNPTVPPARQVKDGRRSKVLIPSSVNAQSGILLPKVPAK